jgi:hypothetical protein
MDIGREIDGRLSTNSSLGLASGGDLTDAVVGCMMLIVGHLSLQKRLDNHMVVT